jgi:hypothetical protein
LIFLITTTTKQPTMTRPSNHKRRKQDNASKARHATKLQHLWFDNAAKFEEFDLSNPKGRSRTEHENKLVLLTLKLVLNMMLERLRNKEIKVHEISWTLIDNRVAEGLQMRRDQVTTLRQLLFDEDAVGTFGDRAPSPQANESPNSKLTNQQLTRMIKEVDDSHSQGETVTCGVMKKF